MPPFLAELNTLYRGADVSAAPLSLQMSRTQIADYLGLRIETVSRAIGKLKERNVIDLVESDEIVVLDHGKLREIGKFTDQTPGPTAPRVSSS